MTAERPALLALPPAYPALTKPATPATGQELRARFHDWLIPLQHPLAVYDRLMGVAA